MMRKHLLPLAALSILGLSDIAHAAAGPRNNSSNPNQACPPEPAVPCYPDNCTNCYCLGPQNYGVNAPVGPRTCNGELDITIAGFYWTAHQDGMELAIDNSVLNPESSLSSGGTTLTNVRLLNNLIKADYKNFQFSWEFGFKVGLSYTLTRDGWDVGALWTWYKGRGSANLQADINSVHTLLPLWSAFTPVVGGQLFASTIKSSWALKLNLVDLELGRNFWTSHYVSLRPFVGLRIAFIDQTFDIQNQGGSWDLFPTLVFPIILPEVQPYLNNEARLRNYYKGVGLRAGLNSNWNLGCGFGVYGNFAASIIYGRFSLNNTEDYRTALISTPKVDDLQTSESFRASRGILDLALGVQWSALFADCKYLFTAMLGWENHLFFNQNQFWVVNRIGAITPDPAVALPNNSGRNVFHQRSGDLDTQGWTLTLQFGF